jgi:hypothetical protein
VVARRLQLEAALLALFVGLFDLGQGPLALVAVRVQFLPEQVRVGDEVVQAVPVPQGAVMAARRPALVAVCQECLVELLLLAGEIAEQHELVLGLELHRTV